MNNNRDVSRRKFLGGAAIGAASAAIGAPVFAQGAWPDKSRTVKVIVPWPPGAANDALGRLVAGRIQQKLGVTSVVENRTGGSGVIGTKAVIQSPPDGYTLLASAFNTAVMPMVLKAARTSIPRSISRSSRERPSRRTLVCVVSASRPEELSPR